jgi:hypothetical protein
MILPVSTDGKKICRIQLTGEGHWVSVALSLGEIISSGRFLVSCEPLLYEMTAVDEAARDYGLANWQGGVISGARYAFRVLKAHAQQVCMHELRGQLGSGDIGAVSSAAAVAVARLLDRAPEFPLELAGWEMKEEVRRPRGEDTPPASPQPAVNGGLQDLPTKTGAAGGNPQRCSP